MATITSPRPPFTPPPSSTRTSLDTSATASPSRTPSIVSIASSSTTANLNVAGVSARPAGAVRRNRTALRDFYGLAAATAAAAASPLDAGSNKAGLAGVGQGEVEDSELDRPDFDAQGYVRELLAREGLEGVLKAEGSLINEIKSLDGDRKALVYDNYSKLIAATETIRSMRANMDPLAPTTSMLEPAVAHIAGTAEALAGLTGNSKEGGRGDGEGQQEDETKSRQGEAKANYKRKNEVQTVRWALEAPLRFKAFLAGGKRAEVEEEWVMVKKLLDSWQGTAGVEELRARCEAVLNASPDQNGDA